MHADEDSLTGFGGELDRELTRQVVRLAERIQYVSTVHLLSYEFSKLADGPLRIRVELDRSPGRLDHVPERIGDVVIEPWLRTGQTEPELEMERLVRIRWEMERAEHAVLALQERAERQLRRVLDAYQRASTGTDAG